MIAVLLLQIVTENAGTASPETPIWSTRFEYFHSEHVTDLRVVEGFTWAPSPVMDFALTVPIAHRDADGETVEGFGDVALRWKYSFYKDDDVMKSTRFAGMLGVEAPTGRWHEEDLPRQLQLGSGTWDVFAGPLFTYIDDRHRFAVELIGRYNFEGDDFRPGASLRIGAAYWYRIMPERIETAGEETEIRGVIEVTSIFYGDSTDLDDGGNITWLSPGVQIFPALWVLFEANVQIPIVETVDDVAGDRKFALWLTVRFLF